jgi:hypothetical protein
MFSVPFFRCVCSLSWLCFVYTFSQLPVELLVLAADKSSLSPFLLLKLQKHPEFKQLKTKQLRRQGQHLCSIMLQFPATLSIALFQLCSAKGIHGRDVTPFLLQRVNELTGGESLKSSELLLLFRRSRFFSVDSPVSASPFPSRYCSCQEQRKDWLSNRR